MAKKGFIKPIVLMNSWGGEGSDNGGGSGGTSDDLTFVAYDEWDEVVGAEDLDGNGTIDVNDYIKWILFNFDDPPIDKDMWELVNPGIAYPYEP